MVEDHHEIFMSQAVKLSEKALTADAGGPFGCVIVKDGEVIATASIMVTAHHDPTAHAEMEAIRAACEHLQSHQLEGCDLYTSCEPCPMCLGAIYWARIRKVYYANDQHDAAVAGFDDSFIYDEIERSPADRKIPMIQLSDPEAKNSF